MSFTEVVLHTPRTLTEARKLLVKHEGATVLAGGTDVVIDLRQGVRQGGHLVSLERINGLKKIIKRNNIIRIGAMLTCQELMKNRVINRYVPSLAEAAASMASFQIRSMATIGGNIARAVPSADLPPSLIVANASVHLRSATGQREVLLRDFFQGPGVTVRRRDEIITEVRIPLPAAHTGSCYQAFRLRGANALAVAGVAAGMTVEDGIITAAAIVLGAVAPTSLFATNAAACLVGKEPAPQLFEQAASLAREECKPIADIRGSVWYRKELIYTLAVRALSEAFRRATSGRRT